MLQLARRKSQRRRSPASLIYSVGFPARLRQSSPAFSDVRDGSGGVASPWAASDSSGGRNSVATRPIAANKIATVVIVRVGTARRSDAGISRAQPFLQP